MTTLQDLFTLIREFEERENLSIGVEIFGDQSGFIREFWEEEAFLSFTGLDTLAEFLKRANLENDPVTNRVLNPIKYTLT